MPPGDTATCRIDEDCCQGTTVWALAVYRKNAVRGDNEVALCKSYDLDDIAPWDGNFGGLTRSSNEAEFAIGSRAEFRICHESILLVDIPFAASETASGSVGSKVQKLQVRSWHFEMFRHFLAELLLRGKKLSCECGELRVGA